jgi:SAM-dependent methyltransferase
MALEDPKDYYEKIAVDYRRKARGEGQSHHDRLATVLHHNRFEKVLGLVPPGRSLRVLDFGCGSGEFLISLVERGHTGHGVDPSPTLIAQAKDLARARNVSPELHLGDVNNIPDTEVDLITALSVILFMTEEEEAKFFAKARKILGPNGYVIANFYNKLIDVVTANRFTKAFYMNALKTGVPGLSAERLRTVERGIEEMLPLSFEAASHQTNTARNATVFRGRNPFRIEREMKAFGFEIDRFIFTRYHLIPPHVAEAPDNFDIYERQIQFSEDAETAEYGPVMASNILLRLRPLP